MGSVAVLPRVPAHGTPLETRIGMAPLTGGAGPAGADGFAPSGVETLG
jgi:hypothetical protein